MARRRWVVLGVVALLACQGGSPDAPAPSSTTVLPSLGDGVVTLPVWLDDHAGSGAVADVSRASVGALVVDDPSIVVLAPPGAEPHDDAVIVVAEATPPPPVRITTEFVEPSDEVAVGPGSPCGSAVLYAAVPGGAVRVSSRGAGRARLEEVAAAVTLAGSEVEVGPVEGLEAIGRLGDGWLHDEGASTATMGDGDGNDVVLVRHVDPAGGVVIESLLCEDPATRMDVPPTVGIGDLGLYHRRSIALGDGASALVGVIANTAAVALHGDRLAVYPPRSGQARFSDEELASFLRDAAAIPDAEFDAAALAIDVRLGDEALAMALARLPADDTAVADGTTAGTRWLLVTRFDERVPADLACFAVVRTASGYRPPEPLLSSSCVLDSPREEPLRASYAFGFPVVGIAEVGPATGSIELVGPGGPVEAVLLDDVRGRRYATFVVPGQVSGYGGGLEGYSMQLLDGSTLVLTIRDETGAELVREVIGAF